MTDSGTILVVDDEQESLALLTTILQTAGYLVRPADSGELALESVSAKAPELILLDIRMPGMDGFEACRRLKAREETRSIPLIFISAADELEERLEGLRLGAVDFISKPFRSEELLARVHTHLELGRLRAELETRVAERTVELRVANEQLERELTEREIIEQALRESEGRFRELADTAPVIIWATGPDRAITFCNRQGLSFAGRTMEELLMSGWEDAAHPDDVPVLYPEIGAAIEGRRPFRLEARFRRADGEYRWMLNTGTPRFVGRIYVGHIGTMIDITDLKMNHEQMLAAKKLESLGVLAAGIAHDFNNLLGSIGAEVDLALSAVRSESLVRESLDRIGTVAVRGSEISNLLMDYAGGKGDDSGFELVNLSTLIEEMIKLLKVSLSKKAVLEVDLDHHLPAIRVNPAQIRRVITNLVTNASEALEGREGFIRVTSASTCVHQESGSFGGVSLPRGEYAVLTISDTGCGMTEQAQANVFDPFYSTKALGRGLGLSAVQGILRAHGGAINLVSAPGQGSTFQIFLPCGTRAAEELRPPTEAEEQPTPKQGTVLLVEDENTLRLAVSKSLQKHGFVVMNAEDGRAALDLFRAHAGSIDLVLLDLTLPDISGPEVAKRLCRIQPDVRIFFTSAYDLDQPGVEIASSEEVLSNFIRKPYRLNELVSTLREALASPRSHSATSNG
ncbi:MAG: response regulator [Acidobacteriaceae bacterium]|nr:response regulator [Acidobacteriaceae bacterium]